MSDVVIMTVDAERCIAGGQCEMIAPDTFRIDDDLAIAVTLGDASVSRAQADELIDRCPSGALSVMEDT